MQSGIPGAGADIPDILRPSNVGLNELLFGERVPGAGEGKRGYGVKSRCFQTLIVLAM